MDGVLHLQRNNHHQSFPESKRHLMMKDFCLSVEDLVIKQSVQGSDGISGPFCCCYKGDRKKGSCCAPETFACSFNSEEWKPMSRHWALIYRSIGCKVILKPNRPAHQLISTLHRKFGETRHKEKVIASNNSVGREVHKSTLDLLIKTCEDLHARPVLLWWSLLQHRPHLPKYWRSFF